MQLSSRKHNPRSTRTLKKYISARYALKTQQIQTSMQNFTQAYHQVGGALLSQLHFRRFRWFVVRKTSVRFQLLAKFVTRTSSTPKWN